MLAPDQHVDTDGFRLRGASMSRVDGFSDVVFGFALTLLVVSLEVPRTYDEFHRAILGFVPFAVCFLFLVMVWWQHFRFFRRYGMHDPATVFINCLLLFTLLFYVYPLKFLFSLATGAIDGSVFTEAHQLRELMTVYGFGFAAIYFCLAALYANAWFRRAHLRLNPLETVLTVSQAVDKFGIGCVGLLCVLVARLLPPAYAGYAGWFFFLVGVWSTVHGFASRPYVRRARARTPHDDLLPSPHQT